MKPEIKNCQNCKKDFTIEIEDFNFYEKIKVPPPTFCPECRLIRRFIWRNERNFYKRQCDLCKKSIISAISLDDKAPVYCHDCWWGDSWDAITYGRDYDFSRSFFEQYKELIENVPTLNLWGFNNIEADYSNHSAYSKNIYLSIAVRCENVFYSQIMERSKDCVDCYWTTDSELCYQNLNTTKCYKSSYLVNCRECSDSNFLFDCVNCTDCFMCSNLRYKSFCIRNKQYKREEYLEKIKSYKIDSYKSQKLFKEEFDELFKKSIHKFANIIKCTNVTGDNMSNSKNAHWCFNGEGEDIKYCWRGTEGIETSYDISGGLKNELIYEASIVGDSSYQTKFYTQSKNNRYCNFVYSCPNSSNLFGCVSFKSKQYCILNKQYTKEEYEDLVPKIIKHMSDIPYTDKKGRIYKYGEFFPPELSPFYYNETVAQEYFPLTKVEALEKGYKWKEREERNYQIDIKSENILDDIISIDESIIGKVIECEHKGKCYEQCTEAFKITPDEFKFYKRMNLPVPHLCPNCRHYQRIKQRNPLKLWHRRCMKEGCTNEFETSYAPDRPEIVYCERCYQQAVY